MNFILLLLSLGNNFINSENIENLRNSIFTDYISQSGGQTSHLSFETFGAQLEWLI